VKKESVDTQLFNVIHDHLGRSKMARGLDALTARIADYQKRLGALGFAVCN
jgi:hypothetical protein